MDNFDNIAQYPMYFAPGCKLLQLQPQMVSDVYDYLRKLFGSKIKLYTRCCGLDDANQHRVTKPSSSPCATRATRFTVKPMPTCTCATSGTSMTNIKTSIR